MARWPDISRPLLPRFGPRLLGTREGHVPMRLWLSRYRLGDPIHLFVADTEQKRPHLRLLSGGQNVSTPRSLDLDVRGTRRDLARLLRAMQAAGHSTTRWDRDAVSRLAHFDAVTARFLIDGRGEEDEVRLAVRGLRAIERWVDTGHSAAELAAVRAFELLIRVEEDELHRPLLRPHHAPEEHSPDVHDQPTLALRSLRAGLRSLEDDALGALGRRLGVPPQDTDRDHLTETIAATLRDDHLLSILVATLDVGVQQVLLAMVHGDIDAEELEALSKPMPLALVVGGEPLPAPAPLDALRSCGLVFGEPSVPAAAWVPVELQPRIHGVLRGLGL